jgi:uncharacterized protein YdaU (DUF1376 family)
MVKSPAYSYYPDAFEQGTAMMTLAEVGGYQRLLNHQWATGAVPGDDPKRLATILRCTPAMAKSIWAVVGQKFVRTAQGWCNERMEREREKQQRRADALSRNGATGGRPKSDNQTKSHGFSGSRRKTRTAPHKSDNQKQSLPSPSLSLKSTTPQPPSRGGRRRRASADADAEHIRKSQEVKRLIAEGLTFVDASRRAGFT